MFDLEKYLTELRDAQMKKLEALNEQCTNSGASSCGTTNSDTKRVKTRIVSARHLHVHLHLNFLYRMLITNKRLMKIL